jgi:membrane associated rhomboid family serine protease
MLEPAMFTGLGVVAVWVHLRFPRLRPGSLLRAILHVGAFGAFATLPAALGFLVPLARSPTQARYIALGLLIPTLTYVLLTWVWLLARILHDLSGGTPRGGHPVSSGS